MSDTKLSNGTQAGQGLPWLLLIPKSGLSAEAPVRPRVADPDQRLWSERDAAYEILGDLDGGECRSLRFYGRRFGWGASGHRAVKRLLTGKLHLDIVWDNRRKVHRFQALSPLYSRFRPQLEPAPKPSPCPSPGPAPEPANPHPPRDRDEARPSGRPSPGPAAAQPRLKTLKPLMCVNNSGARTRVAGAMPEKDFSGPATARPLPREFRWNPELAAWARKRYPDMPERKFREFVEDVFIPECRARGSHYADFNQAAIAWINRDIKDPRSRNHVFNRQKLAKPRRPAKRDKTPAPRTAAPQEPFEDRFDPSEPSISADAVWSLVLGGLEMGGVPPADTIRHEDDGVRWSGRRLDVLTGSVTGVRELTDWVMEKHASVVSNVAGLRMGTIHLRFWADPPAQGATWRPERGTCPGPEIAIRMAGGPDAAG